MFKKMFKKMRRNNIVDTIYALLFSEYDIRIKTKKTRVTFWEYIDHLLYNIKINTQSRS
jgi:hypothetical protein